MHPIDYAIVVVFIAVSFGIGVAVSKRNVTLGDYLLGGKHLPWWLLLGSIVATETSVVTFLSIPGTVTRPDGNLQFMQLAIGFAIGRILVALVMVPILFQGERFSVYELLGARFGRGLQRTASTTFLVTRTLSDGLRLYLAALVLQVVFGLSLEACILICGVVTIGYTWLGGFRAVVINDCLQLLVYVIAGVASLVILTQMFGWETIVDYGRATRKWEWLNFDTSLSDNYTLWSGLVGGTFLSLATHGADQMMAQRYLAAKSRRDAALAVGLSGVVVIVQFGFFLVLGIALSYWYTHAWEGDEIASADQVFAQFVVQSLPPGLTGLALAGVAAAAMSTLSSSLNSSATSLMADWLGYGYKPVGAGDNSTVDPTSSTAASRSRWLSAAFGVLQMLVGIGAGWLLPLLSQENSQSVVGGVLAIASYAAGLLLGLLLLGLSLRPIRAPAALSGFWIGLAIMTWVKFGTSVAWPWHAMLGSAIVYGSALIINRLISPSHSPPASSAE